MSKPHPDRRSVRTGQRSKTSIEEIPTYLGVAARRCKHQSPVVHQMVEEEQRLLVAVAVEPRMAVGEAQSQVRQCQPQERLPEGRHHLVAQLAERRSTGSIVHS